MQIVGDYLYVNMGDKGGIRKVNLRNVEDNVRLPVSAVNTFTVAQDGNIYYTVDDNVYMYPLVTTEADWAAAERVDALFAELNHITLDSEAAILQAQAAYDALTPGSKVYVNATLLAQLTEAENILADMMKTQSTVIILVIVGAAVLLAAAGVVTVLLITKAKKKKEAAPEVVEEETVSEE